MLVGPAEPQLEAIHTARLDSHRPFKARFSFLQFIQDCRVELFARESLSRSGDDALKQAAGLKLVAQLALHPQCVESPRQKPLHRQVTPAQHGRENSDDYEKLNQRPTPHDQSASHAAGPVATQFLTAKLTKARRVAGFAAR